MSLTKDKIQVGDLVGTPNYKQLSNAVGIVTEIRKLFHDRSGAGYTAVTAVFNNETYTFSEKDFTLISKATTHD